MSRLAPLAALVGVTMTAAVVALTATGGAAGAADKKYDIGRGVTANRAAVASTAPSTPSSATPTTPVASPSAGPTASPTTASTAAPSGTAGTATTSSTPTTASSPTTATTPFLATLVTHADTAAKESQAGLKVAMLEFSWKAFEPKPGVFDTGYASWMGKQMSAYRAAGMRVTLGLGLHYAPQWALDLAGSRLVNQNGQSSAQLDLIFNQRMRDLAAGYLARIDRTVGFENIWAVRITSASSSELMFPAGGAYWAYSDGAQNGATRPPTMAPNPMPGWKPGQTSTLAQRDAWARWYLGALDDVADWQIAQVEALGFHGYEQIITPGQGLRPTQFTKAVEAGLPNGLLGRGAVWHLLYAGLAGHEHVTAYVSSVADGSGGDDSCQPSDRTVALNSGTAYYWSATRYIARIAAVNGFTVSGEVPGYPNSASGRTYYKDTSSSGLLAVSTAQARSCGFLGLYWAHDDQVWNGTMPLPQLARYTSGAAVAPAAVH